jgi:hypothetical protein
MFLINFLKSIFKKFVNSFRIVSLIGFLTNKPKDQLLAEAPPASGNWNRLNLEKTWVYFAIVIILVILKFSNGIISNIVYFTSKVNVLNYEGASSPLTIVYKAASAIELISYGFQALGLICLVSLVIYAWKRK